MVFGCVRLQLLENVNEEFVQVLEQLVPSTDLTYLMLLLNVLVNLPLYPIQYLLLCIA